VSAYLSAGAETALLWEGGLLQGANMSASLGSIERLDSPASAAGTNVRINTPGEGEAAPNCNTQNEVSMARFGNTLVAGWVDGGQCDKLIARTSNATVPERISISGYGYSSDGGNTWKDGTVLTPPDGEYLWGDPVLAAGPDGTFYYTTLLAQNIDEDPEPECCVIAVATSRDGANWSEPIKASGNRNPDALQDKPWIAVDSSGSPDPSSPQYNPDWGTVYLAWTEFDPAGEECPGITGWGCSVLFSRSEDSGITWTNPRKLSVEVKPGPFAFEVPGIGTQVAVGPEGEIYVVWIAFAPESTIWFTRSVDGGTNFSAPSRIAAPYTVGHPELCPRRPAVGSAPEELMDLIRVVLNGDIRVNNWPSLAVDVSDSPYRGRIYIALPHDQDRSFTTWPVYNADESDIAVISSADGGTTWSNVSDRPTDPAILEILNDDPTETDQFHPQVAVDSEGRVAVYWYDRRNDPANYMMEMYAAVSTDGGETFGPNFPVSDKPFPPSRTNPNTNWLANCYMGEYNAMVGADGEFLLAWGDNRDSVLFEIDGEELVYPDPNVYFDRIRIDTAT
jgi:hypothetical protein